MPEEVDQAHVVGEDAGIASVILHPFVKCISFLNFGYAIHPTEPIHLPNSEFITVQDGYKIRVLHLMPEVTKNSESGLERKSSVRKSLEKRNSVRNSLTEEYWFTRWNKPLQAGNRCSCSFRRSQRYSKLIEENTNSQSIGNNLLESPPTKIKNTETFVERLLQETLLEAYQELYITNKNKKNETLEIVSEYKTEQPQGTPEIQKINDNNENQKTKAYDNLGYVQSQDEVDTTVVVKRRNNKKPKAKQANVNVNNIQPNVANTHCRHNKPKINKPIVFLLHGIGSTADVWWNILSSLLAKGFEIAAPDMLGHGYSSAPNKRSAYRFKKLLEHALAAFDHYALKDESRKFIVIGHSFGCSLATAIARYRSTQVVQLVLISGGGPTALSPPEIGNEISVFSNLQVLISPLLFCGMKRSLFYSTRGKHFQRCDTDESIPKYVLDYINSEQHWPEGDAAFHRRILIPTLLVHGLKDTNVTLVQECEMERTIPRAFLELIPTAGHMSLLETPEQLSHMILCFVDWWAR